MIFSKILLTILKFDTGLKLFNSFEFPALKTGITLAQWFSNFIQAGRTYNTTDYSGRTI
jgi:hypothetical protein